MNENMNDGTERVTARRRLLRGSFAVPAVMTLSSGSALAASSSLNCFKKLPQGVDSPPFNFFRVQRYIHVDGTTTTRLVQAIDINNLAAQPGNGFDASLYTGDKTWINVATGLNFPIGTITPTAETGIFVSLRFTVVGDGAIPSDFKVTGLATSASDISGDGNVMTDSCWLSV